MNHYKKSSKQKITKVFETNPITQAEKREPQSNAAIPSEMDVKEAKDWVDFNKL